MGPPGSGDHDYGDHTPPLNPAFFTFSLRLRNPDLKLSIPYVSAYQLIVLVKNKAIYEYKELTKTVLKCDLCLITDYHITFLFGCLLVRETLQ